MGFLSKLFGRKKKSESEKKEDNATIQSAKADKVKEQDERDITLQDVEKELEDITTGAAQQTPKAPPTSEKVVPEAQKQVQKEVEVEEKQAAKEEVKQYHIKKHDKGWQIIAGDANRALRVFPTQKEAIDYAKENEFDYLLYRADGTLRK